MLSPARSGPKPAYLFGSFDRPKRKVSRGHSTVLDRHGTLHRPVPGILCVMTELARQAPCPRRAVVVEKCNRWPNVTARYGPSRVSPTPLGLEAGPSLALGIVRHIFSASDSFSLMFGGVIFSLRHYFSGSMPCSAGVRNIDSWVGFYCGWRSLPMYRDNSSSGAHRRMAIFGDGANL